MVETANALDVFQKKISDTLIEHWRDLPFEWVMAQINNATKCCECVVVFTINILFD